MEEFDYALTLLKEIGTAVRRKCWPEKNVCMLITEQFEVSQYFPSNKISSIKLPCLLYYNTETDNRSSLSLTTEDLIANDWEVSEIKVPRLKSNYIPPSEVLKHPNFF